ncbi:MAG: hypothetical protein NTV80_20500 [Verrucomicrobia bacterium]|nr:hypothetical protein [Verrucomicrobiota bacterium]
MNALTSFFDWLLAASLRASLLTLGVCLVQIVLQNHLSPRWRYALWLPVFFVLLMPVQPESHWSAASVLEWKTETLELPPLSVVADAAASTTASVTLLPTAKPSVMNWQQVQLMIWAVGVIFLLLLGFVSFARTLLRFRRTHQRVSSELEASLDDATREVGLRHRPRVLVSPSIQSPAVTGLMRPVLLLPLSFEQDFTTEEQQLILQHELMHLKRGDLPLNTLLCLLMALHWFNPLLWLAFLKVRTDREAACDAQVLENATPQRRSAYGHALLKIESTFAPLRLSLGFIGILQRHASLRARIRSIAAPARTRPLTGLLVVACITCMTFLGVTRAATEDEDAPQIHLAARFIEISEKVSEAGRGDKVLGEALAEIEAGQKGSGKLQIILNDSQNSVFVRRLSQTKGVDLMAAPSIVTRSGQNASIEVSQELVTPGKPPLEKKVGVMLDLLPKLTKADLIDLTLNPRIVEFGGYLKNEKGVEEPVFNERKADANLILKPGQTVLLDLGSRTDEQKVEEITGGKRTSHTDYFKRRAIVLVTVQVMKGKKSEKAATQTPKPSPAAISSDEVVFDQEHGIGHYTGHAKLEIQSGKGQGITATADEIVYHQREEFLIVKAPLELNKGTYHITSEEKGAEAQFDLKTGQLQMRGKFRTQMLSTSVPEKAKSDAEAQAAILRKAKPKQYDFAKAVLGDVLRYVATDAQIPFVLLSYDSPTSKKLVTFSMKDSPFAIMEMLCKAHGLTLVLDGNVWKINPWDDLERISRSYPILKTHVKPLAILDSLQALVPAPSTVKFDEKSRTFNISANRLQHSWVEGYFQGLFGKLETKP